MKDSLVKYFSFGKIKSIPQNILLTTFTAIVIVTILVLSNIFLGLKVNSFVKENKDLSTKLATTQQELNKVEHEDQFVKNKKLETDLKNTHDSYTKLIATYGDILDLKIERDNTSDIDKLFAQSLEYLSNLNYSSASADIAKINDQISAQTAIIAQGPLNTTPANVTQSNMPPGSGFSRQAVSIDGGSFTVDIVAADLNSTRVIVDTATDADCGNDCPVLPLSSYVARNGGFAGINGNYFCPASYPSCVGKTNTFDLLVMNKNKHYFNSNNNVYSTNPAVIFQSGSIRFVGQALEWGRDTGVDGVLSNYPMLVSGGNAVGSGGVKGTKDFVGNKGSTVYIGVVRNATFEEAAKVLKTLGLDNAMNLDEGGSTALWSNGYQDGPGRDIPTAIIFVRK